MAEMEVAFVLGRLARKWLQYSAHAHAVNIRTGDGVAGRLLAVLNAQDKKTAEHK